MPPYIELRNDTTTISKCNHLSSFGNRVHILWFGLNWKGLGKSPIEEFMSTCEKKKI